MQYVNEKPWDDLEIRIYPGANGAFTLYEDQGDGYDYENGAYSTITFTWNDKSKTLTIGKRFGNFTGMISSRKFTIKTPEGKLKTVNYNGNEIKVKL
jgi:alpha-D-xyloside xylohydrolase